MSEQRTQRLNETVLRDLEPADMIEFKRGLYAHWAVYEGDETVIHMTGVGDRITIRCDSCFTICGKRFNKAQVKRDNFWKVCGDSRAKKNNSKDNKMQPAEKRTIIERARSKLGEIRYNILWSNCEHFASWCRYGEGRSEQAKSFMIGASSFGGATALAAFGTLAAAVGIALLKKRPNRQ